jgi:phosphoribosyl-ATP pyrophosphohydrolase
MAGRAKKPKGKPPRRPKGSSSKKKVPRKAKLKSKTKVILPPSGVVPLTHQQTTVKDESAPVEPLSKSGEERIDRLTRTIHGVRTGLLTSFRTNRLLAGGTAKMAQKVIEEAAEVGIEAIRGDRTALVSESADLMYNLVVLWTELGVAPDEVWSEMDRREALLGIAEKLPKTE